MEVQIRSVRMDFEAEQGGASHWSYKGIRSEARLSDWLGRVRNILSSGRASGYDSIAETLSDEVYVFTPAGDLRQLKAGATLLDFAFEIHSNLGVKCTGGRINGRMVPIREVLHTGDVVEILSSKNQRPTQDWLNIAVTSKARNKIRLKLKEEENKRASAGKELLERRLRNWRMEVQDETLAQLVRRYRLKTLNEFYGLLGSGQVDILEIKEFLQNGAPQEQERREKPLKPAAPLPQEEKGGDDCIVIGQGNLGKVEYRMAQCCHPIFGDEVFGFVTVREGMKIHRMSCPNAARLLHHYPYRIQKVRWRQDAQTSRSQVSLRILAEGEPGEASDRVLSVVGRFKASVRSFHSTERNTPAGENVEIGLQIYVPSQLELDKIIATLKKQRNILQVVRL